MNEQYKHSMLGSLLHDLATWNTAPLDFTLHNKDYCYYRWSNKDHLGFLIGNFHTDITIIFEMMQNPPNTTSFGILHHTPMQHLDYQLSNYMLPGNQGLHSMELVLVQS